MASAGSREGCLQQSLMKRWRLHSTRCSRNRRGSRPSLESTSFVKGVRSGTIHAEGRVIKKGRRVAFTESEVYLREPEKAILSRTSAAFAVTTKQIKNYFFFDFDFSATVFFSSGFRNFTYQTAPPATTTITMIRTRRTGENRGTACFACSRPAVASTLPGSVSSALE